MHPRTALVFIGLFGMAASGIAHGQGLYPHATTWSPTGANVPLDATIVIDWTMPMDSASVEGAFRLAETAAGKAWGPESFSWIHAQVAPYRTAARAKFALNSTTNYTVTVLPTATESSRTYPLDQDRDGVGGEVPDDVLRWTFVTEDRESPRVVGTSPAAGATSVSVAAVIEIHFSEPMDTASVEEALSTSPAIGRRPGWDAGGQRLTVGAPINLAYGTSYTIRLAGVVARDRSGNLLDGNGDGRGGDDYAFSFVTEPDVGPPGIVSVQPIPASRGVATSANVGIRFSEAMNRTSVSQATTYTDGTRTWTADNGTFAWKGVTFADDEATFNPFDNFGFATTFTVRLSASKARDLAGFTVDGNGDGIAEGSPGDDYVWRFTVEAADAAPPTVSDVSPPGLATGVIETSGVAVTFTEAMNRTGVEEGFTLLSMSRIWTMDNGTFNWTRGSDIVVYTPWTALAFDTEYTLTLHAALARDVNGNALDGNRDGIGGDDFASSFKTRAEPDRMPPHVVSTSPADAASGVTRTPTFALVFDDAMDREATEAAISLVNITDATTTSIPIGPFEWSAANHTVAFRSAVGPLDWDALHRLTVGPGARDDAGFSLGTPFALMFRTAKWAGRVVGEVVEENSPVEGATVTLGNLTIQSAPNGTFAFPNVAAGTYNLTVSKAGYEPVRTTVSFDHRNADPDLETIDLGVIPLRRAGGTGPLVLVGGLLAAVAALAFLGRFLRRHSRSVEDFEEPEPDHTNENR